MNELLQQMAFDAIIEAGMGELVESTDEDVNAQEQQPEEGQLPEGVKKEEQEDGSTVYTLSFSIDPEIQKEKAAAIPKGTKREDQADVELDETGTPVSQEDAAQDGCPCCCSDAQDEKPFSDALDSLDDVATEDSRHYNTPLENCRAKDPVFCPYHGKAATEKFLTDEITKAAGSVPQGTVISVDSDNQHDYKIAVTVPAGTNGRPIVNALNALLSKEGIKAQVDSDLAPNQSDEVHSVAFTHTEHSDRDGQFAEWVDNLLEDYANDNNSPLDANDLAQFLSDYSDFQQMPGDYTHLYKDSTVAPTQQDIDKGAARDALEAAYHSLRAQVDMADVKTVADADKKRDAIGKIRENAGDWKNLVSEVQAIWNAAGIPPRTRDTKYPDPALRTKFKNKYSSFYTRICLPYEKADADLVVAKANNDPKAMRDALHKLSDYAEAYEMSFPAFKKLTDEYTDSARKYAQQKGVQIPQYQKLPWMP